ncbi:MFS transporter [Actinacidiphila sp. DG2A-62]|uniref:MFS transporter n=1 Tax=Actinacidiphila sp. DG2A-62 TaxID=3108821 RepID=UPI002DB942E3|nr:MFS transporter [Actinacidiphila sp. DG2A-62]MEC3998543.1 MFS transporter [Actinacidiphila sp. DG2A-62]
MLWINLVDKTGSGLWFSVTALYFVVVGGLSTGATGLLLGIGGAFGLAGPPLAGRLADRVPLTRVLLAVQILRGASSLLLLFWHGFWPLLPLVALGSFGERSASVLTKLFAARVAGGDRARYQAIQRTVVNLGYTIGGLAASAALAVGSTAVYRGLLLGDGLSFVAVALLVARCAEPPSATRTVAVHPVAGKEAGTGKGAGTAAAASTPAPAQTPVTAPAPAPANPWRDPGYLGYAALDSVMFLYGAALSVGLPLWIVTRTTAPHGLAAAVFVVNTVIVVFCQVRLSRYGRSPRIAAGALRHVAVWFAVCGATAALAVVHAPWAATLSVIGCAVAVTVVEMIQSAVSWELSVSLAPADAQGAYVGVHGLAQSAERCVGPLLMTSAVLAGGPLGWLVFGAVLAAAALLQRRLVLRRLDRLGAAASPTPLSVAPITVSEQ